MPIIWTIAIAVPLAAALVLRGRAASINVVSVLWAWLLLTCANHSWNRNDQNWHRATQFTVLMYVLLAMGAVGVVAWGLREKRKERVNLGVAGFAISVLFFYFDGFMGKLGRSASLVILGALCLAGGYALEITRRRLVARMETT